MVGEAERFAEERERLDGNVMARAGREIKRFYGIDHSVYEEGALPAGTKELLGLVASFVLRCDDCVRYHLGRCAEVGITGEEVMEALAIGLVVGGSITIPHLRRAVAYWEGLQGDG